ncbi:N-6 DNA methylase, partial [Aeromonas caviae]|uniref:N-6 DNA methylase n=1 Tax=Aeromonas caviae TaxID=648 RepID=UPI00214EACF3
SKQESGIKRRSSHFSCVNTVPVNTYKKFDYIVSNPPFKMDFSDFRDELDNKENKERFFSGIPKIKAKVKDKMEIYQLFLQHIIYSLKPDSYTQVAP